MTTEFPFRYRKIAYAALNVTNLDRSVAFYRDLVGLDLTAREGGVAYLRCGKDHHTLVLHEAPSCSLRRVAFELETIADVDRAFEHFERRGLEPERVSADECAALKQGASFRLREKNCGLTFEFFGAVMQVAKPWVPTVASITRIGHVVIGTTKAQATADSLVGDFGFRVSDYVEGRFSFLRCFPNPFHHTFAVGQSPSNHLHHVNFMVTEIDDIGRAIHRMKKNDVKIVFGPGRHPPSGSVFLYFLDPDGMTAEYSFGMEEFPEVGARKPRMLEPVPGSLDTWGAIPDEMFAKNGAIEGAP